MQTAHNKRIRKVLKMKLYNHNEFNEFCIEYHVEMVNVDEVIDDTTITVNLDNEEQLDLHDVLKAIWNNVNKDNYYDEIRVTSFHYFKDIHRMYRTTWKYSRLKKDGYTYENMELVSSGYDD
jgi:hypothetical protein